MKTSLALLLSFVVAAAALAGGIRFSAKDGWIRAAPPGTQAMAGYLLLGNESDRPLRLVEASSAAFEAIEFHESYEDGEMVRMRAIPALEIPADGSLALAPGGLHLMLLRPTRPIAEGATIIVDLITEEGDPLPAVLTVRKGPAGEGHDHHHH